MSRLVSADTSLTRLLVRLRRIMPLALALLGLAYVLFEGFVQHRHNAPHTQGQLAVSVIILSVLGPAVSYIGSSWILGAAARLEAAERGLRLQNNRLAILGEVGQVANLSLDPDDVLNRSLDSLTRHMGPETGEVWLRKGDQLQLVISREGRPDLVEHKTEVHAGACLYGHAIDVRCPLTAAEATQASRIEAGSCPCQQPQTVVVIPIQTSEDVVGVMVLEGDSVAGVDVQDQEMLATAGRLIGVALENARLHQQVTDLLERQEGLVQERTAELLAAQDQLAIKAAGLRDLLVRVRRVEEKTRASIANDLHDGVRQLIVGALFQAQAIREAFQRDRADVGREIASLEKILQRIEKEMQSAIYSLRPVTLDAIGLVGGLHECVTTFELASGLPCRLIVEGEPCRFEGEAELAAFRIVQEALNNVEAHAGASEASVLVRFSQFQVEVEIRDNGRGFEPAILADYSHAQRGHLGMVGMRERAESVNGRLHIHSNTSSGTRVILTLPLEGDATWVPSALSS